jgi:hypothetical protein
VVRDRTEVCCRRRAVSLIAGSGMSHFHPTQRFKRVDSNDAFGARADEYRAMGYRPLGADCGLSLDRDRAVCFDPDRLFAAASSPLPTGFAQAVEHMRVVIRLHPRHAATDIHVE